MSSKSVREMGKVERMRHSLSVRSFRAVVLMALFVSISAIAFGYYLYNSSVNTNCRENAWHAARTITSVLDKKEFAEYCSSIIDTYEDVDKDLGEAEKDKKFCSSYEPFFKHFTKDPLLKSFQVTFDKISTDLEMTSLYYAFIDTKYNRLVYILDSDNSKNHCPMGFWEKLDNKEADIYLNGDEMSFLEENLEGHKIPAYVYSSERYGYVCTAANLIVELGRYKVMAFADYDMNKFTTLSRRFLVQYVLLMLLITVIISLAAAAYFKRTIVNPINILAEAADSYTKFKRSNLHSEMSADDQTSGLYSDQYSGQLPDEEITPVKNHFDDLDIHTGDEIENLSLTMKDMEKDLSSYMDDLKYQTAEKERINTELSVASSIQEGMLPNKFPPFPERSEIDIFASMDPAKEVGGDFYDFFFVDDDHICFVIADVSGKGVPAALFMMASRIMIKNVAMMNSHSPAQILELVNKGMCSNNSLDMFTTAWLGILEISTGTMKAASAGHEYPMIRGKDGSFKQFNDPHGFVLGGLMESTYKNYEIQLDKGDCIFQYTDGVTESNNLEGEMFGTQRLVDRLNSISCDNDDMDSEATSIIMNVKDSINEFTQGAEQFDDITMLCVKFTGDGNPVSDNNDPAPQQDPYEEGLLPSVAYKDDNDDFIQKDFHTIESSFSTDANRDNLFSLIDFIEQHLKAVHCPLKIQKQILIAAEEIYVNVASYAYAPGTGPVDILIQVHDDPGKIILEFTDSGVPYNPLAKDDPDTTLSADERKIGGLGIFIVKQTMDDVSYRYEDGKNIFTIEKRY